MPTWANRCPRFLEVASSAAHVPSAPRERHGPRIGLSIAVTAAIQQVELPPTTCFIHLEYWDTSPQSNPDPPLNLRSPDLCADEI